MRVDAVFLLPGSTGECASRSIRSSCRSSIIAPSRATGMLLPRIKKREARRRRDGAVPSKAMASSSITALQRRCRFA